MTNHSRPTPPEPTPLQNAVTELLESDIHRKIIKAMLKDLTRRAPNFVDSLHESSRDQTLLMMAIAMSSPSVNAWIDIDDEDNEQNTYFLIDDGSIETMEQELASENEALYLTLGVEIGKQGLAMPDEENE